MIKGRLKLDLSQKISDCGEEIDVSIEDSECLSNLTHEQKVELSNIIHMNMLAKFDSLTIDILGGNEHE